MKDAFGGAFMIKLILIFLTVYISFMAVALNYAKAFRVKNQIINIIEQYEGYYETRGTGVNVKEIVSNYVQQMNYYVLVDEQYATESNNFKECSGNGYCISTIKTNAGTYYIVETYVKLEMPFKLPFTNIAVTIPIRGETKVIKNLLD